SARRSGNVPQGLLDMPSSAQTSSAQFSRSRAKKVTSRRGRDADQSAIDDDDDLDDEAAARDRLGEAKSGVSSAAAIAALIGRSEGDNAGVGLLHGFLNRCCDDLFESYVAGSNYMRAEQAHLKEAFRQMLVPFTRARAERHSSSRGNALLGIFNSVTGGANAAALASGANNVGTASVASGQPAEFEGTVTATTARVLLQVHAEAIARGVELENDGLVTECVASLTSILLSTLGDEYLFPALEDVLESLQDLRQEPDLRTFGIIRVANIVVRLVQMHFQRAIVPFVGASSYVYRDMVAEKNQLMSRVEMSLNLISNKLVGACTQWIMGILAKQRKGDFRPADDDYTAFEMGTQPCRQCADYLHRIERACRQSMGVENQERVLTDVGITLHRMLMEHLRKFVVSVAGGLVLVKDVSKYREAISSFAIPALNEKFSILQDISNIFVVQPAALKSLLDEGPLARLDRATVQGFVQMREDGRTSSLVRQFL
ncbi:Exocyst complex component 5, partial [Coemansia linderi]